MRWGVYPRWVGCVPQVGGVCTPGGWGVYPGWVGGVPPGGGVWSPRWWGVFPMREWFVLFSLELAVSRGHKQSDGRGKCKTALGGS